MMAPPDKGSMPRKLLIVLLSTDPRNVEEMAARFYHAAVAAAMDYEIDVVCTATAGKVMIKGALPAGTRKPTLRRLPMIGSRRRTTMARASGPAPPTSNCST